MLCYDYFSVVTGVPLIPYCIVVALASDYMHLNLFLRYAVKLGYCDKHSAAFIDLFNDADDALFLTMLYNKAHVLHTYLP